MATGWSSEETRTLLGIWGAADVQAQLDGKVQRKIEAVEPEKEPWHSFGCSLQVGIYVLRFVF